jgi:hypothetical protein
MNTGSKMFMVQVDLTPRDEPLTQQAQTQTPDVPDVGSIDLLARRAEPVELAGGVIQPNPDECGNHCPTHNDQQRSLFGSDNARLRSLFHIWTCSPAMMDYQTQRCNHGPRTSDLKGTIDLWRSAGTPDPIEWLQSVAHKVSSSLLSFLGLSWMLRSSDVCIGKDRANAPSSATAPGGARGTSSQHAPRPVRLAAALG